MATVALPTSKPRLQTNPQSDNYFFPAMAVLIFITDPGGAVRGRDYDRGRYGGRYYGGYGPGWGLGFGYSSPGYYGY